MAEDYLVGNAGSDKLISGGGGPNQFAGGDFFGNNPNFLPALGGLGAAAGLGFAAFGGSQQVPYTPQLQSTIGSLGGVAQTAGAGYDTLMARGSDFLNPILTGQLPAGQEQVIQNMIKGQETATKGRYASLGLSGSTMEGDALTTVQNQAMTQRYQLEQYMAQLGQQSVSQAIQELGLSEKAFGDQGSIYASMAKLQMQQDQNSADAIASFAKALGVAFAMF